jgi:hypothetical protein
LTNTGFEKDTDVVSGIEIGSIGAGGAPPVLDADPAPTVPGKVGNGRLLASFNRINILGNYQSALLARTLGSPVSISIWWRPLVEFDVTNRSSFLFEYLGSVGVSVGVILIGVELISKSIQGDYDVIVTAVGILPISVGTVSIGFRDWNLVTLTYDGTSTLTVYINGEAIGTVAYANDSASDAGVVRAWKNPNVIGTLIGVIDSLGAWINHELTPEDVTDIFEGWTYP